MRRDVDLGDEARAEASLLAAHEQVEASLQVERDEAEAVLIRAKERATAVLLAAQDKARIDLSGSRTTEPVVSYEAAATHCVMWRTLQPRP